MHCKHRCLQAKGRVRRVKESEQEVAVDTVMKSCHALLAFGCSTQPCVAASCRSSLTFIAARSEYYGPLYRRSFFTGCSSALAPSKSAPTILSLSTPISSNSASCDSGNTQGCSTFLTCLLAPSPQTAPPAKVNPQGWVERWHVGHLVAVDPHLLKTAPHGEERRNATQKCKRQIEAHLLDLQPLRHRCSTFSSKMVQTKFSELS